MTLLRLLRKAVLFEIALYRSTYRWVTRRPDIPQGSVAFPYIGAVTVILWAFIIVSAVELVVVHVILPWETIRLVADIAGIWGLVWMLGFKASFHVYPHAVDAAGLHVRNGTGTSLFVPWEAVATIRVRERSLEKSKAVQLEETDAGALLSVVVVSRTNVDVVLREPLEVSLPKGPTAITELRLFADEPRGLVRFGLNQLDRKREARSQS